MLSQDLSEAADVTTDPDLGLSKAEQARYNLATNRLTRWGSGATEESSRVSESLKQVADGYEWIEGENSKLSEFHINGGPNQMRAV